MILELTDEEALALIRLLRDTVDDDRYPAFAPHSHAKAHPREA
jgi:hypothetical protein